MEIALYNVKRNLLVEEWLNDEASISSINFPPKFEVSQFVPILHAKNFFPIDQIRRFSKLITKFIYILLEETTAFFFFFLRNIVTKIKSPRKTFLVAKLKSNRYISFVIHLFVLFFHFELFELPPQFLTANEQRFANNGIWRLKEVVFPRGWTEGANDRTEAVRFAN